MCALNTNFIVVSYAPNISDLLFCAVYTIFGFLDVWGHLPVNFFLKDDLGWSPSQVMPIWGSLLFDA